MEEPAEPYDNLLEEPAEEPAGQEQPWGLLDELSSEAIVTWIMTSVAGCAAEVPDENDESETHRDDPQEGPLPTGALEQETPEQEKPEQEKPEQEGHHCADNLVEKPRNVPEMALAETSHGEAAQSAEHSEPPEKRSRS